MPHFLVHLSLSLILLFTAALFLIRAQPYDDHELRDLLLPEGCPAPCFMGIRPGVTTVDEAMKILEGSEWVTNMQPKYTEFDRKEQNLSWGFVYWDWKENIPLWEDHNPRFRLGISPGSMSIVSGLVSELTVSTSLNFGRIQVSLGDPKLFRRSTFMAFGTFCTASPCSTTIKPPKLLQYELYYPFNSLVVGGFGYCPSMRPDWNTEVFVTIKDSKEFDRVLEWFMNIRNPIETERQYIHLYCQG